MSMLFFAGGGFMMSVAFSGLISLLFFVIWLYVIISVYQGKSYYFCSDDHKRLFDATPAKFAGAVR